MYIGLVEKFIKDLDFDIVSRDDSAGLFVVESESEGIANLMIGVNPPVVVFEQYLFSLRRDDLEVFRSLLVKNRDIVHGAFVLTADGRHVLYRHTLQLANLDESEFVATINSLSLMLSEFGDKLIAYSKR